MRWLVLGLGGAAMLVLLLFIAAGFGAGVGLAILLEILDSALVLVLDSRLALRKSVLKDLKTFFLLLKKEGLVLNLHRVQIGSERIADLFKAQIIGGILALLEGKKALHYFDPKASSVQHVKER